MPGRGGRGTTPLIYPLSAITHGDWRKRRFTSQRLKNCQQNTGEQKNIEEEFCRKSCFFASGGK